MGKEIYYHYCSVETFFNIIKTSTIRFGNPLCMNDSAEIIWLLKMAKEYVGENSEYSGIVNQWERIENIAYNLLQEIDLPYIFCLSYVKIQLLRKKKSIDYLVCQEKIKKSRLVIINSE